MIDAIETITEAIPCNIVYGRKQAAEGIARALSAAGFTIMSKEDVEAVREECAKIADQWECSNCNGHFHPDDNCSCDRPSWNGPLGADQIAAAIRARKETGE